MSMSREELDRAFRVVASMEFADIPHEESNVNITFSEPFTRKMETLIRKQKSPWWALVSTASKRVACFIIVLITLFATSMSVKAIREPVVAFFKEIHETFIEYFFKGDVTEEITRYYSLTYVPDGFCLTLKERDDISNLIKYEHEDGRMILLEQNPTSVGTPRFDNENNKLTKMEIQGVLVEIYENKSGTNAVWTKDGYLFRLTCYSNFHIDEIITIIKSVQ